MFNSQEAGVVSALAQLSTHLHPDAGRGRGGSFRRRKSRSRSPSVLAMHRAPSPSSSYHEENTKPTIATMTTTTTTITTTATTVSGAVTNTTSVVGVHPGIEMQGDELYSPVKGDGVFADTVTDLVDIVKFETSRKGRVRCK